MSKLLSNSILCLVFFIGVIHTISAQKKIYKTLPDVLIASGNKSVEYKKFVSDNNIKLVSFVNDRQFLDEKIEFAFNPEYLREQVRLAYPDPKAKGMAYIDLEYPYLEYLMNEDVSSDNFKKSLKLFLGVLKFVKTERPDVKWGYYAIPFTSYWERKPDFFERHKKVQEIINNSDVLFPSIYIFYNNTDFDAENIDYLKDNTKEMIRIGKIYNKKVYPFIMSRYHPSTAKIGNGRISTENFRTYVSEMMKTDYKGKKVDGIVLWNFDDYSYRINEPKIHEEFSKSKINFDKFYDSYIISLLNIMIKER
ncbi:hypothetical protein [Chryseobacterium vrystaatense]|uniref:Hyaluronidase n=1 Tax=Chryseobacterium vrystaatense TaxID=307480 RepID=A0ABR4UIN8_9FLAO|nr:hypothetical protein [Chryseobacterium vrystaatense]KFF24547.1 hypothetical protein IW16_19710 [Chryseobacterium vrystaatense]